MPSTYLLGAVTQLQRDDISEALLRYFASKQYKYRFIAFEGDEAQRHDPGPELLKRIHDLKLPIQPVSGIREYSLENGERVASEHAKYGMNWIVFSISLTSDRTAELEVNECPLYADGAGQRITYSVVREGDRWKVTKSKPGPIF